MIRSVKAGNNKSYNELVMQRQEIAALLINIIESLQVES